jgi:hypothetical protein
VTREEMLKENRPKRCLIKSQNLTEGIN